MSTAGGGRLAGRIALVTGASSGIGEATAMALAQAGARVAIAARRRDRLESLASRLRPLGAEPLVLEADLLDEHVAQRIVADTESHFGKLDILATASAYMAGYNLRLLPVVQSLSQLDATYGKDVARTLLTNHALQIVFAPREQQDANDYSDMLGTTTVRRQHVTRGRETTRNETEERRALMLPQELKALGGERQVLLYEGMAHAVLCDKIRYYRERRYKARLLPKVEVPRLEV